MEGRSGEFSKRESHGFRFLFKLGQGFALAAIFVPRNSLFNLRPQVFEFFKGK